MLTDAHLHLGDIPEGEGYPDMGRLGLMFTCTAQPSEWHTVPDSHNRGIKRFYGVHPWYADEWDGASRAELIRILESDPSSGIGEIGLDSGRGDAVSQRKAFGDQLSIAAEYDRTTEIHMVSDEHDVLEAVRRSRPGRPPILHAFRSESYVKPFSEAGCCFSVNPRILSKKPETAARILRAIPRDRLLLESDAPNTPPGFPGMGRFVSAVAELLGIPAEELENTVYDNLKRLFRWMICTRAPACCWETRA